ncbi:MAG: membrane-bound lytic murein transglycosylase MltF [Methylophilus sp.]|nr:membrane-bound lytic murein transglycosylase MltF [Methylophilus sp.]
MRLIRLTVGLMMLMLLGCSEDNAFPSQNKPKVVNDPKVIRFVTINSPNTYYINESDNEAGLEYELATRFVKSLGPDYQAKFIVVDSFSKIIPTLLSNKADIAAADISVTIERKNIIDFSEPYHQVQQHLAFNRDRNKRPKNLSALDGHIIAVPAGTSFAERIRKLGKQHTGLVWDEIENTSSEQLLEALSQEEIDYTIADSHLLAVMQYYYPNIQTAFAVGEPEKIAWAVARDRNPALLNQINAYFKEVKRDGTLRSLIDRYHGNTTRLKTIDVKTFLARTRTLLPKYTRLFKEAQDITDVDWRLLAAISYQESHWDTFSTSPTNVRGLMMLTEQTSDMMNVQDRLDPKQSIPAGAKFFLWMKDRFPERIPEPDRTYFALAAYNNGVGHLEDARVLAQRLGLNPDSWADVKTTLLKLNDPQYYTRAKHGYCSCGGPIIYTESVRSYYQILLKHQPSHSPDLEPFKIAEN